jgi:spore maturation protein CgeB
MRADSMATAFERPEIVRRDGSSGRPGDPLRVLFVGENWFGSCARACSAALRRIGHDVLELDAQTVFPQWSAPGLRLWRRLLSEKIVADFNSQVLAAAETYRPDLLLAFKGPLVRATTLRRLRRRGIRLYNYYPDRVVFVRGSELEEALGEYDCVFDTKQSWDGDMARRLRLRRRVFVPHGYDPEIHRPTFVSQADRRLFACDISFIGTYTERKGRMLDELVRISPSFSVKIFGNDWGRSHFPRLRQLIQGAAVRGQSYAKAIAASRINLALMGVSDDALDETTTRTYEIPACGGFMLHERTSEVLGLYEEGREIACFSSAEELASKISYYLNHADEAAQIAAAGRARAVPAYSYDVRMGQILDYCANHCAAA